MNASYASNTDSSSPSLLSWLDARPAIIVAALHTLFFVLVYSTSLGNITEFLQTRAPEADPKKATYVLYSFFYIELLLTLVSSFVLFKFCKKTPCQVFFSFAIVLLGMRLLAALVGGTLIYVSLMPCLLVLAIFLTIAMLLRQF